MNSEIKNCQNCKNPFTIEPDDFAFYEKMQVPPPVLCPECRFQRRAAYRNERTLYTRTCGLCKRSVISMFNPNSPYVVYCNDCWASDKWDPFSYGIDFDFHRPFFDQLKELSERVPKSATYSSPASGPNINSEYTNFAGGNKDCYLIFNSGPRNENCAYARGLMDCQDTFDAYYGSKIERVYEVVNAHKSAQVLWSQNVIECLNSRFLLNCSNCQNCFGCVNLRNKFYCFLNEQLTKEEYENRTAAILGSHSGTENFKKQFEEFSLRFPRRENTNLRNSDVSGDYIFQSKNCHDCFEVGDSENLSHVFSVKMSKDSRDLIGHGRGSELLLEGVGVGWSQRVLGSWWAENCHDVEYSFAIRSSEYCLGCDSVKGAKHAVLNKKYDEETYGKIRRHIVDELKSKNLYGLFMPPKLALFAYNETTGNDNMLLSKEEALKQGFRWEENIQVTKGKETVRSEDMPDNIKDVPDSILNEIMGCGECGRNYRLIKPELEFYRLMSVPLPRKCFNCRFVDRIKRRGPMKFFARKCAKCQKSIKTTYAPDRPETVYCEQCYQAEVI